MIDLSPDFEVSFQKPILINLASSAALFSLFILLLHYRVGCFNIDRKLQKVEPLIITDE